jgi:type VI secretion system secreted protein Hcp
MGIGIRKQWVAAGALMSALLWAVPATAALNMYLTIKGSKQGSIKGDGASGTIPIKAVTHDVVMASDHASGMASGKRQHGTITITKEIDRASPMLFQALNSHEVLSDVNIGSQTSGSGAGKIVQTIELKDAVISGIRKSGNEELITLDYDTIQVTHVDGSKSATDDWEAPK